MNADESNEVRLTDDPAYERSPVWSPDGKKIAFAREVELWVMNVDGSDERLLAADIWGDLDWQPNAAPVVPPPAAPPPALPLPTAPPA